MSVGEYGIGCCKGWNGIGDGLYGSGTHLACPKVLPALVLRPSEWALSAASLCVCGGGINLNDVELLPAILDRYPGTRLTF